MIPGGNYGEQWITSPANPRVRRVISLRRSRPRARENRTLVEGAREITLALDSGFALESLFFCPDIVRSEAAKDCLRLARNKSVECLACSPGVFARIAVREAADGLLAVVVPRQVGLADLTLAASPLLMVLEAVEKPGNIGAILRSADAAGVDAVLVCQAKTDLFGPNVVRASLGALFCLPVIALSNREAYDFLRRRQLTIMAASPAADLVYTASDMRGGTALVVGAEDRGLSRFWLEAADYRLRIPMRGRIDSLNASAAATLLLYEAVRQRGTPAGN